MTPNRLATVVGAGIAGLTTALCLARSGWSVEILERAPELREAGAGLQLSPNALRVLAGLGLLPQLSASGVPADVVTLRSGRSGRGLAEVPVSSADGTPYLSILRTDLQAVLLAAAEAQPNIVLRLGKSVSLLRRRTDGAFDVGLVDVEGDAFDLESRPLVIAADGVHSTVAGVLGLAPAVASGLVAWRMMLDEPIETRGIEAWLGQGLHAVAYPVDGGRRTNLVAIGPNDATSRPSSADDAKSLLLRRFSRWSPALLERFERAGPVGRWPLLIADRMSADLPAGLHLVGDAAHAMLPFAAQGAAMAIEDAAVLAHALATEPSLEDAGRRFRAARRPRIERVRKRVDFHRFVYHLPPPLAWGRNAALALRPRAALRRDLAWLYDWAPPEA